MLDSRHLYEIIFYVVLNAHLTDYFLVITFGIEY
jgi:hypothetical protein